MSVKGGLKGLKKAYKRKAFEGATIRINGGAAPPLDPRLFLKLNTRAVELETSILPQNFYCYYYYYY